MPSLAGHAVIKQGTHLRKEDTFRKWVPSYLSTDISAEMMHLSAIRHKNDLAAAAVFLEQVNVLLFTLFTHFIWPH